MEWAGVQYTWPPALAPPLEPSQHWRTSTGSIRSAPDEQRTGSLGQRVEQEKPRSLSDPLKAKKSTKGNGKLAWVTYTDINGFKDSKVMKKIRRHVMVNHLAQANQKEEPPPRIGPQSQNGREPSTLHTPLTPVSPPLYRSPMPMGAGFDPFDSLPQASDKRINVQKLKRNCIIFFHSPGLKEYWTARALRDRLFFLSSLTVTATHADVMNNCLNNPITLALEGEVVKLLRGDIRTNAVSKNDLLLGSVLHVASAGHYNAPDDVVLRHYNFLRTMVDMRGGFQSTTLGRDLVQLVLMNSLSFSITRDIPPQRSFLEAAVKMTASYEAHEMESPAFSSQPEFLIVSQSSRCCDTLLELLRVMRQLTELALPQCKENGYRYRYEDCKSDIRAQLLTFPPASSEYQVVSNDFVYESCRIASVIFERALYHSYTFSEAAKNTSLIPRLKEALSRTNMDDCWGELSGLLLWVGMIGAAAAKDMSEKPWLVAVVMRVSIINTFDHGEAILAAMTRMVEIQMGIRHHATKIRAIQ